MKMNIICATDDNYAHHCGIMLTSLFENNKHCDIYVYILTISISQDNIEKFESLAKVYGQNINVTKVDPMMFDKCPIRPGDHITIASYFRFVIPSILPIEEDYAIYLDCDMIVSKSISDLLEDNIKLQLSGIAVGVVAGASGKSKDNYKRLEYDPSLLYFNAGVMVINLDYWRRNDITNKLFDYVNKNPNKVKYHDQDAMNYIFRESKVMLPIKYNLQHLYLYDSYCKQFKMYDEIALNIKDMRIVHYTSIDKPWMNGCKHPFANEYLKYKSISLWKEIPLISNPYANHPVRVAKRIVKKILNLFGANYSSKYADFKL